jgi:hypothetical protein
MGVHGGGNFWSVLASMSPFETLRKHRVWCYMRVELLRRQTLQNDAQQLGIEKERLAIEKERLAILKKNGVPDEQLEPILNRIRDNFSHVSTPPPSLPGKEQLLLTSGDVSRPMSKPYLIILACHDWVILTWDAALQRVLEYNTERWDEWQIHHHAEDSTDVMATFLNQHKPTALSERASNRFLEQLDQEFPGIAAAIRSTHLET